MKVTVTFYGPKIDFHIKDALNRSHQCGNNPAWFPNAENWFKLYRMKIMKRRPVVIQQGSLGSLKDRPSLAILIEALWRSLPAWGGTSSVKVIQFECQFSMYKRDEVADKLAKAGVRCRTRCCEMKNLGYKIREQQMQKVLYSCYGDKNWRRKL